MTKAAQKPPAKQLAAPQHESGYLNQTNSSVAKLQDQSNESRVVLAPIDGEK